MSGSTFPSLGELRSAALEEWRKGCELYGPAFGQMDFLFANSQAIHEYGSAYPGDSTAAITALRKEHEGNCDRPHEFMDVAKLPTDELDRLSAALKPKETQE